jgi:diguanylate cyclase (GGDEF)-like protein
MPEFSISVAATFAAQMIGAAVMALLLLGFHRQYRKSYLLHWTYAWAALAVYHLATSTAMFLAMRHGLPPSHPGRLAATLAAGIGGYLQLGWLAFGVHELVRRRPVRMSLARRILAVIVAAAVAISLLFLDADWPAHFRYLTRVGLRGAVAAAVCVIAAIALWRTRRRREGVGHAILSAAFAAYAIEQLHYLAIAVFWSSAGQQAEYASYLGYVDFLLQSVMGVGMIACLLEDEREAAELAAGEIEHLAYHDALTGLPNRPLFVDRLIVALAQASRANQKLAVLFLDLDRFKDINDSLGHSLGDGLLKAVADRIRRCVREGDTVARFGGDEFTLLIPRIDHVEDAAKIAQKIIETLKIPFTIHEHELFVTTSIGLSIFPTDGLDPETLVRNADTAMYRAKEQGRDNYQLYAPAMNARALERLALENMLRKALSANELVLHYQPLINAETRSIEGVEALVRWNHPEFGMLLPAHFISVAEISGLILPIGDWILRSACRQIRAWQRRHDSLTVSVNLSARQFQQTDLVEQVRSAIYDSNIEPWRLQLEITESNAMQNSDNTIYLLRELKALGVRIAMDDFGTGYSSLNYLKRFPIDTLKLDRSFVNDVATDPSDAAIVSAVISMAHSLSLQVVAEGVETEAQLDFLTKQHCDVIQGFFFSGPMPAEELEPYLVERKMLPVQGGGCRAVEF